MKRVLFNALAARSPGGGVARYASELGRRLALADERVTVVTTTEGAAQFAGVPAGRLVVWKIPGLPKGRLLLEEFKLPGLANQFDLLYQPDFKLPRGVRIPAIVTAHDLFFEQFPGDYGFFQRWYKRGQAARAASRAEGPGPGAQGRVTLVSLTRVKAEEIQARYGLSEAPRVIHPGIDSDNYAARIPEAEREYPFGHFLFMNSAGNRKGSTLLVQALRGLSPEDISLITWAGPWNWRLDDNELVNQLLAVKMKVWIEDEGGISEQYLRSLYSTCTALLFPSQDEGFGLPVLEAIAAGCPVIASDLPALREVFGDAPIYLPADRTEWENTLREAARNPPALDPAARAIVLEKCGWPGALSAHRALLDEMVGAA